jgi:ATP-binding cassette subfamily C (CFTR/MRP) protein 1
MAAKPCPEAKANFFSRLTYHWLNGFIWLGYKHPLEQQDLYDLVEHNQADYLVNQFESLWQSAQTNGQPVRLFPILYKQFGPKYIWMSSLHLIQAAANIGSPVVIGLITSYVKSGQGTLGMGIILAIIFFALQIISSFALNKYFHYSTRTGMRIRACLTAACYRKLMKVHISNSGMKKFTVLLARWIVSPAIHFGSDCKHDFI